jgi:ABC-type lipoprotein export system ATPase subunit
MTRVDWKSMSVEQLEEMQGAIGRLCQALEAYIQARQAQTLSEGERQRFQQAKAILTGQPQIAENERRRTGREM